MGFKMRGKSPMMKKLLGKQHNLPEHLKAKIEAAPESPAKKYKSDAQRKAVHASKAEKSPVKKKVKFREDTKSSKYIGKGEEKRGDTTADDAISDYNFNQDQQGISVKDKAKTDDNLRTTADRRLKAKTTKVDVKIKGRKSKDTIVPTHENQAGGVDDVKKVKMTRGSGKNKVSTKVKYDKEGNIKKETVRYGRLGLRKKKGKSRGTEATVGTKEGKDLKGAAAAEAIVSKSGSNIRGKKRKTGDESALTKKGYKSKKC